MKKLFFLIAGLLSCHAESTVQPPPQQPLPRILLVARASDQVAWGLFTYEPTKGDLAEVAPLVENIRGPAWPRDHSRISFLMNPYGIPGQRIGFYAVNTDGSNLLFLDALTVFTGANSWSPDGSRIVYVCFDGVSHSFALCVIGADGQGRGVLVTDVDANVGPAWSPNGLQIAFRKNGSGTIYTIAPDGSNLRSVVTVGQSCAWSPIAWSPDGGRIAFNQRTTGPCDLWTANADGTALFHLTDGTGFVDSWPSWSPDATQIVFIRSQGIMGPRSNLFSVSANGTNLRQLTDFYQVGEPSW